MSHWMRLLCVIIIAPWLLPQRPAQAANEQCFAETGKCLSGRLLSYWEQNGGLPVFGFPLTAAREELSREDGKTYTTQWFERARFELHPENAAPYDVQLGRLGADRRPDWEVQPRDPAATPNCRWFATTTINVCDQAAGQGFRSYWQSHGLHIPGASADQESLALFGLPLTSAQPETNPTDGKTYLTQWFERARFEWHPDEPAPYHVLLGLLGSEIRGPSSVGEGELSGAIAYLSAHDIYVHSFPDNLNCRVTTSGQAERPVVSPDGVWISFFQADGLYLSRIDYHSRGLPGAQLACTPPQRIVEWDSLAAVGRTDILRPSWSPDSRRLAYSAYGVYTINRDGSGQQKLTPDTLGQGDFAPVWSPNGNTIAFLRGSVFAADIYTVPASGGQERRLLSGNDAQLQDVDQLAWSPDANHLAFSASGHPTNSNIYTINAQDGNLQPITNETVALQPAWSHDGQLLFERYDIKRLKYDIVRLNGPNLTERYPNNFLEASWNTSDQFVILRAGSPGQDSPIYVMPRDGGEAIKIANGQMATWQ